MHVEFEKNINGFQEARKLKMILEHYAQSDATDKSTLLIIESVIGEIDDFISDPMFDSLSKNTEVDDATFRTQENSLPLINRLVSSIRSIGGPTKKEMLLSKQRQELLERAERAESMAFDALAETAEIVRERVALKSELKQVEQSD